MSGLLGLPTPLTGPCARYLALMLRRIRKSGWVYLAWLLRLMQAATVAKIRGEGSRPPVSLESEPVKVTFPFCCTPQPLFQLPLHRGLRGSAPERNPP